MAAAAGGIFVAVAAGAASATSPINGFSSLEHLRGLKSNCVSSFAPVRPERALGVSVQLVTESFRGELFVFGYE